MKTSHAVIIGALIVGTSMVARAGLETGTYINDLITSNPTPTDLQSLGDDHLRLIKTVLKNTFPNATHSFPFPSVVAAKTTNYLVSSGDANSTLQADTTAGTLVFTLPTLTGADAGFRVNIRKSVASTNCLFIVPASGSLVSGEIAGVTRARRCIPYLESTAVWTGASWYLSRAPKVPIGTILDSPLATPVGYELSYGQTLASASTDYQEYYLTNGSSGAVPDLRGRAGFGDDDMGGVAANRITVAGGNFNGTVLLGTGGQQNTILTQAQLPNVTLTSGTESATHTHTLGSQVSGGNVGQAGADQQNTFGGTGTTSTESATHTHQVPLGGSGNAHPVLSPAIIVNKLIVVE